MKTLLNQPIDKMWIGTFHSLSAKILRSHCNLVQLKNNFIFNNDNEFYILNSLLALPVNIEQDRLIYDDKGWLIQVKYPEWTVHYESYQTLNGLVIPKKITIKGRSYRLTLVNSVLEISHFVKCRLDSPYNQHQNDWVECFWGVAKR